MHQIKSHSKVKVAAIWDLERRAFLGPALSDEPVWREHLLLEETTMMKSTPAFSFKSFEGCPHFPRRHLTHTQHFITLVQRFFIFNNIVLELGRHLSCQVLL